MMTCWWSSSRSILPSVRAWLASSKLSHCHQPVPPRRQLTPLPLAHQLLPVANRRDRYQTERDACIKCCDAHGSSRSEQRPSQKLFSTPRPQGKTSWLWPHNPKSLPRAALAAAPRCVHGREHDLDLLDGYRLSVCLSPTLRITQRRYYQLEKHPCAQLLTDSGCNQTAIETGTGCRRGGTRYTVANPPDLRVPHQIAVSA